MAADFEHFESEAEEWLADPEPGILKVDLSPLLAIEWYGGSCPVQSVGTCCGGRRYYFRARHTTLMMLITREPVTAMNADGKPVGPLDLPEEKVWSFSLDYGKWPAAGYIARDEGFAFMALACFKFYADTRRPIGRSLLDEADG